MRRSRVVRKASDPIALTAAIDRSRRVSEGAVIQASVRARLLGMPLLRLDATVMVMPAAISASPAAITSGDGLAEAVRSINEGAEVLTEVRRNGRRRRLAQADR